MPGKSLAFEVVFYFLRRVSGSSRMNESVLEIPKFILYLVHLIGLKPTMLIPVVLASLKLVLSSSLLLLCG
jgi:uncharacterized membrane protein YadS